MHKWNALGVLIGTSLATAGIVTACVGDDPTLTSPDAPSSSDGGDRPVAEGGSGSDGDGGGGADSSTTDAGANVDGATPAFEVRTLAGLRLWLESSKDLQKAAVGSDLVSWRDSSGHWADGGAEAPDGGAHVALPVAYSGGGAVYPGVVANGIGGRPAVSFENGPKLAIANHPDFLVGTGDFVIAAVAAVSSGAGAFWRLTTASTAPSGTFLGPTQFCSFLGGLGAQPKCTSPEYAPNTSAHAFVVRRKSAQAIFRVDGTTRATYDFGVENPDLGVQTYQQASAFIGGGIVAALSELVFVVGTTADSAVEALEAHLKTKYAIP